MNWIHVLNIILWIINRIALDEDKNGIPDLLESNKRKQNDA